MKKGTVYIPFILFAILLILLYYIDIQIPNCLDIIGSDEANYLDYGVRFNQHITQEWGPSYNFWYYVLSKFAPDRIQLYYLNIQVMVSVCSILIFVYCYQLSKNAFLAFIFSVLFALHPMVIGICPKISLYCILIMLTTVVISTLFNSSLKKIIIVSIGLFWSWYARPEFSIGFLASIIIIIYLIFKTIKNQQKLPYVFLGSYVVIISGIIFLLKPFVFTTMGGVDKMYVAFVQHWGIYYTLTHQKQLAHVTIYELYNKTLVDLFGPERTFVGIIKHQPLIVLKHIGVNILIDIKWVTGFIEQYFIPSMYLKSKKITHLLFLIIIAGGFYFFRKDIRFNPLKWTERTQITGITLFLFFIGICIPNLLIGFQEHYFLLMFGVLFLALLFFISINTIQIKASAIITGFLLLLMLIIHPDLKKNIYMHTNPVDAAKLPNRIVYAYIKKHFSSKDKHTMIAIEGGCERYIEYPNLEIIPGIFLGFDGKSHLENFKEKNIDLIYVDKMLKMTAKNNADQGLHQVLENPANYGFKKRVNFSNLKETYLLIKE